MKKYLSEKKIEYELANLKNIVFEVTDSCNLKCKYCAYGKFYLNYDKRENKNLSFEKAVILINYLIPFWQSEMNISSTKNIIIGFYGGEPLLNMPFIYKIIDFVENLKISNIIFSFNMTTNGILLDKYIEYLVEKKFQLMISLDGNKKNNSYRLNKSGKSSFEQILKNIDMIQSTYPEYFKNNINFNAVLHNKNSVEEIHNFFKKKNYNIPLIQELSNTGIQPHKVKEFVKAYKNHNESLHQSEHYEKIEKERFIMSPNYLTFKQFLNSFSGYYYRDYNELLYEKYEGTFWVTGTCPPFNKKIFLTVSGKILPCERIGQNFVLGQVNEDEVNMNFTKIAEKYNKYFSKLEKQCTECYRKNSCLQCIFHFPDIEGKPVCNGFVSKQMFEQYVKQNMEFIAKHPEDYYKIIEEAN